MLCPPAPTPRGATLIQECIPVGCILSAAVATRVYPSMHWTGGVSQHALDRGCIPACTGQGVYPSMHWAGVCIPWAGGCLPRGFCLGVCPGGCLPQGMSARGLAREVSAGGSATHPSCKQNRRYLWKHNLAATTLRTIIICFQGGSIHLK